MFITTIIPLASRTINDCVTRAISLATDTPYKEVKELLTRSANDLNCCRLCLPCYRHLLEDYFGLETIEDGYHTVGEISDMYPEDTILIRVNGHITASLPISTVFDLFDCRDEICTHYWIVE